MNPDRVKWGDLPAWKRKVIVSGPLMLGGLAGILASVISSFIGIASEAGALTGTAASAAIFLAGCALFYPSMRGHWGEPRA